MALKTPGGGRTHRIRSARAADLRHVADVEDSGGAQFVQLWPQLNPVLLSPASSGSRRADQPGFLLVAAVDGEPPVGFAHVLDIEGHAHLEQISVRPEVQRQGLGSRLVRAVMAEARTQGYDALSLCTFRDVPWNGPFYAQLGFAEVTDPVPFQRRLREHEHLLGLDQDGVRVVMQVPLR